MTCRHDTTPILCSNIVALSVELGWVVNGEEHFEKGFKRYNLWIEIDDDDFGMACCSTAHFFVGWIQSVSTCIAGESRMYSSDSLVSSFDTLKTAASENCLLHGSTLEYSIHERLY